MMLLLFQLLKLFLLLPQFLLELLLQFDGCLLHLAFLLSELLVQLLFFLLDDLVLLLFQLLLLNVLLLLHFLEFYPFLFKFVLELRLQVLRCLPLLLDQVDCPHQFISAVALSFLLLFFLPLELYLGSLCHLHLAHDLELLFFQGLDLFLNLLGFALVR